MWATWKRCWRYLAVLLRVRQDERADPKVQVVQAIDELRSRHRAALEQAAKVVAAQRIAERKLDQLERDHADQALAANRAVLLAAQQRSLGETARADVFDSRAEEIVLSVLRIEREVADQRQVVEQTAHAAEQAKAKVADNAAQLQHQLDHSERLLNDIDRTRMLEELNRANRSLDSTLDAEGPTFASVAGKVERGLQQAIADGELGSLDPRSVTRDALRDVDRAVASVQAQARLDTMRAQAGVTTPEPRRLVPPPRRPV